MIKAVIFDAGGVLHTSNDAQDKDLKHELGFNDEQLTVFYNSYLPLLLTGKIDEVTVWARAKDDLGIRDVSVNEKLLSRAFKANLRKTEEVYAIVDRLKTKRVKVMLLTNVSEVYAEVLEKEGHYEPFEHKILSYKVGLMKPDPDIFKLALQELAVKPSEAIFIDDLECNVSAAVKLGMQGITFKSPAQLRKELETVL